MARRSRLLRPGASARVLVAHRRSAVSDVVLAVILAAIAGASNAGGFFAIGLYTSHMTGYLSQIADNLVIVNLAVIGTAILAIGSFIAGAACSAFLVQWAQGRMLRKRYALPLAVEGGCLAAFAIGGMIAADPLPWMLLVALCFIMGMQNATITRISGARIRTTHATGMITDIGIEIGRALAGPDAAMPRGWRHLHILLALVIAYVLGGVIGAAGFTLIGFGFALPLAAVLLALSLPALLARRRAA